MLQDYHSFMTYYKACRKRENKPELSRTRQGILSFVQWAEQELGVGVIESDVCTYPTSSVKELDKVHGRFQKAGRDLFWEVLCQSNAGVLILYGVRAFRDFMELLDEKGGFIEAEKQEQNRLKEMKIEELEDRSPLFSIWIGQRKIAVYAVRHFMYYGKEGDSFAGVKKKLIQFWNIPVTNGSPMIKM